VAIGIFVADRGVDQAHSRKRGEPLRNASAFIIGSVLFLHAAPMRHPSPPISGASSVLPGRSLPHTTATPRHTARFHTQPYPPAPKPHVRTPLPQTATIQPISGRVVAIQPIAGEQEPHTVRSMIQCMASKPRPFPRCHALLEAATSPDGFLFVPTDSLKPPGWPTPGVRSQDFGVSKQAQKPRTR
jgi:hypothetical protein